MSKNKHNCPHCEAVVEQGVPSWEALEQTESCESCGGLYAYVDSEGGPSALTLIKVEAA
jgi:uncharacterized protein (DUF983 family)